MNKFFILLTILFLATMMFIDYKKSITNPFPQFTEQELIFICNEEGLDCF